jgi:hypothetical protein
VVNKDHWKCPEVCNLSSYFYRWKGLWVTQDPFYSKFCTLVLLLLFVLLTEVAPFEHIVFVIVLFEFPSKTLYTWRVICKPVSSNLYLYQYIPFLVRLWARRELIPTGNTTENRQNNATYVSYDPAKARNEFARSNCTYTREFDVIPATGASYWPIIAQCTRVRVKPDILKIQNKYFYSSYSNEILYTKALEYKEYFQGPTCGEGTLTRWNFKI